MSEAVQRFAHRVQQIRQCVTQSVRICLMSGYCIDQNTANNYTIGYSAYCSGSFRIPDTKAHTHR